MRLAHVFALAAAPVLALALGCSSDSEPATAAATGAGGATSTGSGGAGGAGGAGGQGGGATAPDRSIVLLYTSDEHSHLFGFAPEIDDHPPSAEPGKGDLVGGIARRAAVLARERDAAKKAGKPTLTVSAGDNQMGALPHVAFEEASLDYGAMTELGYDVTTIGNHELDFGPKALANAITAAKAGKGAPAIVASNIHFSAESPDDDDLAAHFSADATDTAAIHPWRVVTVEGGLKVGFVGICGVEASHFAKSKGPVRFSEVDVDPKDVSDPAVVLPKLYAELQPIVDELRQTQKVDLVVALSHSGIFDPTTPEGVLAGEDGQIAANVAGLDVIISGHQHRRDPKPMLVKNAKTQRDVIILNGGAFGQEVGRVEIVVPGDPSKPATFDPATQAMLPVDDATLPDPAVVASLDASLGLVDKAGVAGSFLEGLLSRATGAEVKDDPATSGDLYFYPLSKTDFDVAEVHPELELSADATLAQADALGLATDLAIESAGVVRLPIKKGKTGVISAADAFAVLPLGASFDDGSVGYPLVRAYISGTELRGVAEASLSQRRKSDVFDLGWAGMRVEYDATRPFIEHSIDLFSDAKGQVMKIALDTDHSDGFEQYDTVIFDRANGIKDSPKLFSVVASSYVAEFASDVGVGLKDADGKKLALLDARVKKDGVEVKQLDAFFAFLAGFKDTGLPARYDAKSPGVTTRLVCIKGC